MVGSCSADGENRNTTFWSEILEARDHGRPMQRWKDNIKMDVRQWSGFNWVRIGFIGWLL